MSGTACERTCPKVHINTGKLSCSYSQSKSPPQRKIKQVQRSKGNCERQSKLKGLPCRSRCECKVCKNIVTSPSQQAQFQKGFAEELASIMGRPQLDTAVEAACRQQRLVRVRRNAVDNLPVRAHRCQQPACATAQITSPLLSPRVLEAGR